MTPQTAAGSGVASGLVAPASRGTASGGFTRPPVSGPWAGGPPPTKALSSPLSVKDASDGTVRAVFSTFNVIDADGDVVLPGAFTEGAPVRISAFGHGSWHGALPVGKGRIRTTSSEAILDGRFFVDITHARDAFNTVRGLGELAEWSFSLDNVKARDGKRNGRRVRYLERIDTTEVSPVLKGAGVTRTQCAGAECSTPKSVTDELDRWERYQEDQEQEKALRRFWTYAPLRGEIPVELVTHELAKTALLRATWDLGLSRVPDLVWCEHDPDSSKEGAIQRGEAILGTVRPGLCHKSSARSSLREVWVNVKCPQQRVAHVVRHECRHLWQVEQGVEWGKDRRETDAEDYARSYRL